MSRRLSLGLVLVALAVLGLLPSSALRSTPSGHVAGPCLSTFSICAYDPDRKEWGVAVASRVLAAGSVVPFGQAGVGAIATQSFANVTYGPNGLKMLAEGKPAQEVIDALTSPDERKALRQVGIVDAKGQPANFTGKSCMAWAGAKAGQHYTCQGNILAGPQVVEEMGRAFEAAKGPLAWRMMAAMEAGEKAGGDKRGKQSAGILVVRAKGGYAGLNDRAIDLRVDDHKEPIEELARILALRLKRPQENSP